VEVMNKGNNVNKEKKSKKKTKCVGHFMFMWDFKLFHSKHFTFLMKAIV
jgi:hypothetical protein